MPKWRINGYFTCSVVAEVEAETEEKAREIAEERLADPRVHTDHHQKVDDGSWNFNEFDDQPEDCIQSIEELTEEEDGM